MANWTLVDGGWGRVTNKSEATRLGFSLLLRFFEQEGRFPGVPEEVPRAAVEYVADLVKVPAADFAKYTLVGRTAEYHRKQIREALGFRPSTVADEKGLAVEVCPVDLVVALHLLQSALVHVNTCWCSRSSLSQHGPRGSRTRTGAA